MNYQTGDVIILWGKGILSKIVAFLENALEGTGGSPSHTAVYVDDNKWLSAEASGVKLVSLEELTKKVKKFCVFRNKMLTTIKQEKLRKLANSLVGTHYDFFLYLRWALRVLFVFIPFLYIVFLPFYIWLKQKAKRGYTCSELVAYIYNEVLGEKFNIDIETTTPADIYAIAENCLQWEKVFSFEKEESFIAILFEKIGWIIGMLWLGVLVYVFIKFFAGG